MVVQTSRFGQVEIQDSDILSFPEGILGFTELRKFVLLEDPQDEIFVWLQSLEHAQIAFPVLEPELFQQSYTIKLAKNDLEALGTKTQEGIRVFSIITIPEEPRSMTANLKAPIVIYIPNKTARQCVLQDNNLAIREPIFTALQQRLVTLPGRKFRDSSKASSPQAISLASL